MLTQLQGSSHNAWSFTGFGDLVHHEYLYDDEPFWTPTNRPEDITPYLVITAGPSISVYDRGIRAPDMLPSGQMIRQTDCTAVHPVPLIRQTWFVNSNNAYMIIEKNTVGTYLDVTAKNVTNSALQITNLPPDTVFTLDSLDESSLVTGVTSGSGEITIPYDSRRFSSISGLTLNLFHNSLFSGTFQE